MEWRERFWKAQTTRVLHLGDLIENVLRGYRLGDYAEVTSADLMRLESMSCSLADAIDQTLAQRGIPEVMRR